MEANDKIRRLFAERAARTFRDFEFTWTDGSRSYLPMEELIYETCLELENHLSEKDSGPVASGRLQVALVDGYYEYSLILSDCSEIEEPS